MIGEDLISLVILLAACGAVYFAYLTVREGRQARRESAEMRSEALATQAWLEQALQLDRIAELPREICDLARAEHVDEPPIQSPVMPIRLSDCRPRCFG